MHHSMHRLIRAIQTPAALSCRRLSTNSFSNGSKIPKCFTSRVAPVGAVSAFMIGGAILFQNKNGKEDNKPDKNNVYIESLSKYPGFKENKNDNEDSSKPRIYSIQELGAMCEKGRIVVAFQGGLYDMTHFTGHPGGVGRLQMAAGNDLEVYWQVYTQHNR